MVQGCIPHGVMLGGGFENYRDATKVTISS